MKNFLETSIKQKKIYLTIPPKYSVGYIFYAHIKLCNLLIFFTVFL